MSGKDRMADEYAYVDYVMGLAVKMFTDARSRVRSPGLYLSLNSLIDDIEDLRRITKVVRGMTMKSEWYLRDTVARKVAHDKAAFAITLTHGDDPEPYYTTLVRDCEVGETLAWLDRMEEGLRL